MKLHNLKILFNTYVLLDFCNKMCYNVNMHKDHQPHSFISSNPGTYITAGATLAIKQCTITT